MDPGPGAGAPASALCLGCGLCCNGVLYTHALLESHEVEPAIRAGLNVIQDEGGRRFTQPCACNDAGPCAIYADRPAACASYQCALLKGYLSGEASLEQCAAKVSRVKQLVASITARLPEAEPTAALWPRLTRHLEADADQPGPLSRRNGELLMDVAALTLLCKRDFDPKLGNGRE